MLLLQNGNKSLVPTILDSDGITVISASILINLFKLILLLTSNSAWEKLQSFPQRIAYRKPLFIAIRIGIIDIFRSLLNRYTQSAGIVVVFSPQTANTVLRNCPMPYANMPTCLLPLKSELTEEIGVDEHSILIEKYSSEEKDVFSARGIGAAWVDCSV